MQIKENVGQNVKVFGISWDIFNEKKSNLGQECVTKLPSLFRTKLKVFPALDFLFHPP